MGSVCSFFNNQIGNRESQFTNIKTGLYVAKIVIENKIFFHKIKVNNL